MQQQIKSRQRVTEHGEVFTAEREVKAMCDLVKQETERIDSRFLEPACGTGNFLTEILARKLSVVKSEYGRSPLEYEKYSLLAVSSLYGVDIMADNVETCRERLYKQWDKQYKSVCKKECNDDTRKSVRFILSRNIVCGNALTLKCVDENCNDTEQDIVFSEWAFVFGSNIQRSDYSFDELVNGNKEKASQLTLSDSTEGEGTFLRKYICNYRRLGSFENETEANNLCDYMKTKFFRFLLLQALTSINISKDKFLFVPLQDFSKPWTDSELYEKYNLTDEEINFIESMIRPMDLGGDNNG